jgi:hypothetical protein
LWLYKQVKPSRFWGTGKKKQSAAAHPSSSTYPSPWLYKQVKPSAREGSRKNNAARLPLRQENKNNAARLPLRQEKNQRCQAAEAQRKKRQRLLHTYGRGCCSSLTFYLFQLPKAIAHSHLWRAEQGPVHACYVEDGVHDIRRTMDRSLFFFLLFIADLTLIWSKYGGSKNFSDD